MHAHRIRSIGSRLAMVLALALSLAPSTSGASSIASRIQVLPAKTNRHIGLFGHDWNGAPTGRSDAAWIEAAQTHDVLVGIPATYCDHIDQLHAANPHLLVLVYDLGPYTARGTPLYDDLLANHPEDFARDAAGNLLTVQANTGAPAFPSNTLMEPGRSGWRAAHAQRIADLIARCNFDGVYVDSMGVGPLTGNTTGVPINPDTGTRYTATGWMSALGRAMADVKQTIGDKFLLTSGLGNGISYRSETHLLSDAPIDGIVSDVWMRLSSASVGSFPATSLFQANLDMVRALQAQGTAFFGWTKVWTASATETDFANWDRFGLASYLLVKGPRSYYSFSPSRSADRTLVYHRFEQADLGRALGPYSISNGVYVRMFRHGSVRVDPVAHTASIVVT
jgi:hypothetical protein